MMKVLNILKALMWLLLLVIFTYTPILVSLLLNNGSVMEAYFNSQHQAISLFINLGLLGMVLIDYFSVFPSIDGKMVVYLSIGVLALFVIYVHSGIIFYGNGYLYKGIINNQWLSVTAHIILLLIVLYIKYLSLSKPNSYIVATSV